MNSEAHKQAIHEGFWMLIGAFLPIFVDSGLKWLFLKKPFLESVLVNINTGEVFIFTSALVTPFFFYLVTRVNKKKNERILRCFPITFLVALLSLLGGIVAFCYYRLGKELVLKNPEYARDMQFNSSSVAVFIFLMSLVVWYYASYNNHCDSTNFNQERESQVSSLRNKLKQQLGN